MKKNIVLGIIANAALATTVLVGPSAQAGEMSGGSIGNAMMRLSAITLAKGR